MVWRIYVSEESQLVGQLIGFQIAVKLVVGSSNMAILVERLKAGFAHCVVAVWQCGEQVAGELYKVRIRACLHVR